MICMEEAGMKKVLFENWKDFCGDNKYIHRQLLDRVSRGG